MTTDQQPTTPTADPSKTPYNLPSWISAEQSFELLESISEAFYGVDAEWRFIYLNRKAEQLWGRTREDLIGKCIWDEFPHGIGTQSYDEMHYAMREQQTRRFETFSAFLSRWFEVDIYPTRIGLSIYFRDIHQRKIVQAALEHSQQQLRLVTDSLPLLVSYVDLEMRYQFVNKGYVDLFGLERDQIIGKQVAELIGQAAFDATKPELERVLSGQTIQYEQKMPPPLKDRFARIRRLPHVVEDGTIAGIITMIQDITDEKLAEKSLSHLAAIVLSSKDAIFSTTLDGIITSWNQGAEKIFGYSADEILHKPFSLLVPPEKQYKEATHLKKISDGKTIQNYDSARLRKDGSLVSVSVSMSSLKDEEGNVVGISRIAQDITERKRGEEGLARLAAIITSSSDAISTATLDGVITSWNQGAERIFGYSADEILHKPFSLLVPPEKQAEEIALLEKILAGITIQNYDSVQVRKDGSSVPIAVSLSPLKDEKGHIIGVSRITQDITKRKRGEEGLARLAAIVNSSNDAIFSATLDGIITSWNLGAEIMFDFSADEIIGQSFTLLMRPDEQTVDLEMTERRMRAVTVGSSVPSKDVRRVKKDGTEMFISISMSPLRNERGEVIGSSIIAKNITERKRAEAQIRALNEHLEDLVIRRTAQLQAANQELDSFAYVVSHDLKAPLRGITQLAGWLMSDYAASLDEDGLNMLKMVVGRSKRMHEMIEGILQYSRVGRVKESSTEIHLAKLVMDVVDLLAAPTTIEITVAPTLPVVHESDMRLRQVFQNLIGNAIRYMGKPTGKISITCADRGSVWEFAIADTGIGIAPQYHDKIFLIFQTLAPRDEVESTGIGLALVKKIVETLGGRIWLDSVEGQGTTFYFTLPKENEAHS